MEVSKLTITKPTQAILDNPIKLSLKRKRAIRIASIIAHLERHDFVATTSELFIAAGYHSNIDPVKAKQNGNAFIQNLVKTGVLQKEPFKGNKKKWTILKVEPVGPKPIVETVKVKVLDIEMLRAKAKEFYWDKKSDSLHEFIEELEKEGNTNESV